MMIWTSPMSTCKMQKKNSSHKAKFASHMHNVPQMQKFAAKKWWITTVAFDQQKMFHMDMSQGALNWHNFLNWSSITQEDIRKFSVFFPSKYGDFGTPFPKLSFVGLAQPLFSWVTQVVKIRLKKFLFRIGFDHYPLVSCILFSHCHPFCLSTKD
jgi:hypothetical protein